MSATPFPNKMVLKSTAQQMLEAELGRDLPALLEELYGRDGLSQAEIAEKLGLDASTVSRWMRQWGIPLRYGAARRRRLHLVDPVQP